MSNFLDINKKNIHLWVPGMFEFKGGIQVFSQEFLSSISEILGNSDIDVFLLHDKSKNAEILKELSNVKFHYSGFWHHTIRNIAFSIKLIIFSFLNRPSLIITTHLNFTPLARLVNQLTGIPYWTIAHGVEAWNIKSPRLNQSLCSAERILAVSDYTRQRLLEEQGLAPEKITVFPNTVDIHRFIPGIKSEKLLKKYNISLEQPVLLSVCRLCASEAYKSYDTVLNALPKVRRHYPNVHYLIVGKGDDTERVEKMIRELDLGDCVTLTGFIPDEELCEHYQLCDLFVLPSKLEGFGIVYLEAMACGKPVIGGNQDGAIDALDSGNLGVLVDPDNIDLLSQTLIQTLDKKYDSTLIFSPKELRKRMISLFGPKSFQSRLAANLKDFGMF